MSNKKLRIEIIYGCGKKSIQEFTTRKGVDAEYARLVSATEIYNGHTYTSDFTFRKIK
jgi:hypothetical protein